MTALLAAGSVLLAAFVKGSIGFGFPMLATPLLSLVMDVKAAVAVLILPNIVMDAIQFGRRGAPAAVGRRFAPLLLAGAAGTLVGTRLLVALPSRAATLLLGVVVLAVVGLGLAGVSLRVPARWERGASPVAGFLAGVLGGLTNVPGTPLVVYFQALGLAKHEFVSAIALTFVVYKLVQLGAVSWFGLLPWSLVGSSLALTGVALGAFAGGLAVQDRLDQRTFNRAVLAFLGLLGAWLVGRSL